MELVIDRADCMRVAGMKHGLFDKPAVTLVENNHSDVEACTSALEEWNYGYQLASNVPEGLKLLRKQPTPILITDLHAPYENINTRLGGLNLLEQVRQDWPDTHVMMLADDDDLPHVEGCIKAGADRLLLKPLRRAELRLAIDSTLAALANHTKRLQYQRRLERQVQRQSDRLRIRLNNALASLFMTLDIRDRNTHAHSRRVKRYAALIVKALNLDTKKQKEIVLGAKLHDIGKIGIRDHILLKPAPLNDEEYAIMQTHPTIGADILRNIKALRNIIPIIECHHERFDGHGYPRKLQGVHIQEEARIVAIADAYDAMTSHRAYRRAMDPEQAFNLLMNGRGQHWDGDFVEVFVDLMRDEATSLLLPRPRAPQLAVNGAFEQPALVALEPRD